MGGSIYTDKEEYECPECREVLFYSMKNAKAFLKAEVNDISDFKTKKALKEAVAQGEKVRVYQPNADLTGAKVPTDGKIFLEGPHFPAPHTWYAEAVLKDGIVIKVK